jgi:cold-inducible RNA-binding protein
MNAGCTSAFARNTITSLAFGSNPSQTTNGRLPGWSESLGTDGRLSVPKVYVGNLATTVTSHDLREHFARAGEVLGALAVSDKASGLCRGFGFVEMAELADVSVAFSLLNNTELNGRRITIEPDPLLKNGRSRNKAVEG